MLYGFFYIKFEGIFEVFNGSSPCKLAKKYKDFLSQSGIKNVKLAGCNTGVRFKEDDHPPVNDYTLEDLTQSYAMKFSKALVDLGLMDIIVTGYRGELSDEREKNKYEERSIHSYVKLYRFFPGQKKTTSEEVRGMEASVSFKNGHKCKDPSISDDLTMTHDEQNYLVTY